MATHQTYSNLIDKSQNAAILDNGASKTVHGELWFNTCLESLANEEQNQITFSDTDSRFRFGECNQVKAIISTTIPVLIGQRKTKIKVDVVPSNIPLLLSWDSMIPANIQLNFNDNTISAFGLLVNLIITKNGH